MRKNYWMLLALVLILPAMLLSVSCAKKAVEAEPAMTTPETTQAQPEQPQAQPEQPQAQPEQPMMNEQAMAEVKAKEAALQARNQFINVSVYFDFDSSALLPAAQKVIADKVDYMMANPGVTVTIAGNCDERGTEAYNLALGQRRADAVRDYMINLGIFGSRLSTISYGEERPVDYGHNEEAWAKNRRDDFSLD